MIGGAPKFWWGPPDWRALALTPLALVYGAVARSRLVNAPRARIDLPVLCIGNLTVGGSGKTPVAIACAKAASDAGLRPGFLSRGHGGTIHVPHVVDAASDDAGLVGDEPLLLAAHAPVAVTPDRGTGARLLQSMGCNFIIMDDGFQSARIHIDHALIVIDGRHGIGNGHVLPAGPMRAPLADQIRFADSFLRIGEGDADATLGSLLGATGKPLRTATLRTRNPEHFRGRRFLAFAGIGHPDKFFDTLRATGGIVDVAKAFPDHHAYSEAEVAALVKSARGRELAIVTTAKDAVRLGPKALAEGAIETLEIEVHFDLADAPRQIIEETVLAYRKRAVAVAPNGSI